MSANKTGKVANIKRITSNQTRDIEEYDKNYCIVILKFIRLYWKTFFLIIWPCICLVVFFIDVDRKIRCLYVTVLMMGYFTTECLPLCITGVIPIALLPLLSVRTTANVCANYMNNTNFLLICALLISHSIRHSGLHYRMAFNAMLIIGCSPRRLLCGLCITSVILSMWLVNIATTAMMCPIIHTILEEYEKHGIGPMYCPQELDDEPQFEKSRRPTNITKAFFLTVSYSSSIGGTCTLVGSGTNITFKTLFERYFPDGMEIGFYRWLQFNSPSVLIITIVMFIIIQIMLMGLFRKNTTEAQFVKQGNLNKNKMHKIIKVKLANLGPITCHEIGVSIMYFLCVVIWITSKPFMLPGWIDLCPLLFEEVEYIKITPLCTGALICFLILTLPAVCDCWKFLTLNNKCHRSQNIGSKRPKTISSVLLPWDIFQQKMCWALCFMIAGGVALADANITSGLAVYLGGKLSGLKVLPNILITAIICGITGVLTEFLTNAACCNIVTPIFLEMAVSMQVNPLQFAYPAAICSAWGFMLPVGSPVTAIMVAEINIKNSDLMRYGFTIKLLALTVVTILFPTYGYFVYDCDGFPEWAKNHTAIE